MTDVAWCFAGLSASAVMLAVLAFTVAAELAFRLKLARAELRCNAIHAEQADH